MINDEIELELIETFVVNNSQRIYCATSGGKDSAVIMHLTSMVYPDCLFIHNPKSETHSNTVEYLYKLGDRYNILYCKGSDMPLIIKKYGFLGQIDGTKRCEWNREGKSTDVIINGESVSRKIMDNNHWINSGIWGIQNLYPILEWSDEKVFEYCKERNIPLSKEYGDEYGFV